MKALGRHLLCEYYDCDVAVLADADLVHGLMRDAAVRSGATIVAEVFHPFTPHGVSGVIVIAESHLAIHTWPEHGYAAVDLFTCGDTVDPWVAFEVLRSGFGAGSHSVLDLRRGMVERPDGSASLKDLDVERLRARA
jgi:S-adenosylmethionine decarboxylase proenzyme